MLDVESPEVINAPVGNVQAYLSAPVIAALCVYNTFETPAHTGDTPVIVVAALGTPVTVMNAFLVTEDVVAKLFVTVRDTVYVPTVLNVCEGVCKVEVLFTPDPGSPKFHAQLVSVPEAVADRSWKFTAEPAQTFVLFAVKSALKAQLIRLMLTSLVVGVHAPLLTVHRMRRESPTLIPVTVDVGLEGVVIAAGEAPLYKKVHAPVNGDPGLVAPKVAVLLHNVSWFDPATAAGGGWLTVAVNVIVFVVLLIALSITLTVIVEVPY